MARPLENGGLKIYPGLRGCVILNSQNVNLEHDLKAQFGRLDPVSQVVGTAVGLLSIGVLDKPNTVLHGFEERGGLLVCSRHWLPLGQGLRGCVHGEEELSLSLQLTVSPVALEPDPSISLSNLCILNLLFLLQDIKHTVDPVGHGLDLLLFHAFLEISSGHLSESLHHTQKVRPDLLLGFNRVKAVRQLMSRILCITKRLFKLKLELLNGRWLRDHVFSVVVGAHSGGKHVTSHIAEGVIKELLHLFGWGFDDVIAESLSCTLGEICSLWSHVATTTASTIEVVAGVSRSRYIAALLHAGDVEVAGGMAVVVVFYAEGIPRVGIVTAMRPRGRCRHAAREFRACAEGWCRQGVWRRGLAAK
ncbi:hypothetical protein HG531_002240 [Fusarium graminearum]|nr:hypothetical protein HG531_002240 [Fusarium graminearum]